MGGVNNRYALLTSITIKIFINHYKILYLHCRSMTNALYDGVTINERSE